VDGAEINVPPSAPLKGELRSIKPHFLKPRFMRGFTFHPP